MPTPTLPLRLISRPVSRMAPSLQHAEDFLSFVNASPTPFHAVKSSIEKLEKAGFTQIKVRTARRHWTTKEITKSGTSWWIRKPVGSWGAFRLLVPEDIEFLLSGCMVTRSSRLLACDDLDLSSCAGSRKKYQVQGRAA
ncbi:hypothetical protein HDK64DRAFT_102981 [Phyllosticta capitalensis]